MPSDTLVACLKERARQLGFDLVGICPAVTPAGIHRFFAWIEAGYAGEMHYLSDRAEAYRHPQSVLPGVRSLVMLGMRYRTSQPREMPAAGQGCVSCYAWGQADYHDVIHDRLRQLGHFLRQHEPAASVRGVVDSAPLLEREFAQLAGLGWIGKHTLLLNKQWGSWFFLAALLTDLDLPPDEPFTADHCGTCRACLDACPTDAFPQPYVLDARKCLSYLTIELRDHIPDDLREDWNGWLFGCDICQEVCPWNRRHTDSDTQSAVLSENVNVIDEQFLPRADQNPMELGSLFLQDDQQFRERFRQTPLWRTKRRGILRNAAMLLGQQRDRNACDALIIGLSDIEPLVRAAAAWALGRIDAADPLIQAALRQQLTSETDDVVRASITHSLGGPV